MGLEHLYERIITAALGALLGVCALLAGAKFIRSRAKPLSPLLRAHGAVFAVMMGLMAMVGMFRSFGKLPQNYGIMELWNYGNEALGIAGEAQFHNASLTHLHNSTISESDVTNGWRVVETRESREIVGRDAFDAPQMYAPWLLRGGYRDKMRIVPYGWSFPWRDGMLHGITVLSRGEIRPDVRTLYFPRPFDVPLAMVPSFNWRLLPGGVSNVFWHAVSPSNSLVVTWENSPVSRDVNSLTNFQAELFADGSFVYRYDDRTVAYSRVHPLDLDFDGLPNAMDPAPETPLGASAWNQSDAWAAAEFPDNAAEIAAAGGYAAWATRRASDPNRRLVGLQIASPGGRWPICVEVGGVPVMADGRAELLYAIDCGAQVPFSLSDGGLGAVAVSCVPPDFQAVTLSNLQTFSCPCERMIGDVTLHLDTPRTGWLRRIAEVSVDAPNLTHLHPGGTAQLAAVVTNCHADAYLGCTWHGGAGISFSNAHSLTTTVAYASSSQVQWATNNAFLVTSYMGGYCVTNANWFTVGMENEPTPSFTIDCQDVFFLNDADVLDGGATNRPERIRPVTLNLLGPYGTNGTVKLSSQGSASPVMFYVDNGVTNLMTETTVIPLEVTDSFTRTGTNILYVSCPQKGTGTITATLTLDGGETLAATSSFKCIEPLRKLVTTEKIDGRFINPSRLVMGTNAVLQVDVNGDFDATNVHWCVVSGPAIISPDNGFTTTVTPTGTGEDVVVEARFNGDEIQPRFVLPVVEPRVIPVKIYVFHSFSEAYLDAGIDPTGVNSPWKESDILAMLNVANETFAQVGITFNLIGVNMISDEPEAWNIPYGRYARGLDGKWVWQHSDELMGIVLRPCEPNCVRIYFVGDIQSDEKIKGMATPYGVFMGRRATRKTLAHELGHALGLNDCYAFRLIDKNRPLNNDNCLSIEYADNPVDKALFNGVLGDWGEESGRGFYEASDTRKIIMQKLLMHGSVLSSVGGGVPTADERGDIPTKCVISLKRDAKASGETCISNVGEKAIEEKDSEVHSK